MPEERSREVTVGGLLGDPRLGVAVHCVAGDGGLERPVRHARVQKSGLALAGHFFGVVPSRIQILGETEMSFLHTRGPAERVAAVDAFFDLGLSCVIVTRNEHPPDYMIAAAERTTTPLYVAQARSSRLINALHAVLDERLAPTTQLHGVLVDVFGVGLLLLGKSGIGKSECALGLVMRGHRLVADDRVRCEWHPPGVIFGAPAELLRNHVEIRGLGVLNLEMLFGVTAVRERKRIDIVIRLVEWEDGATYERLGVDDQFHTLLGVALRELRIPVRPGRDMAAIAEIAARQELLRRAGHTPAHDFVARIEGSHQPDFAHVQALLQRPYESMMPPRAHDSSERPVPPEEGERGEGERGDAERGDPTR